MSFSSFLEGKKILVTGGAGFIGSCLVEQLLDLDCDVMVLDNLSSGVLQNLQFNSESLSFVRGDVRDFALVQKLTQKSNIIFHLAEFIPNTEQNGPGHVVKFSMRKPLEDLDVSVRGTLNVLEAAKETRSRIVFVSTAAVYGKTLKNPIKETTPLNPTSPYGASKSAAETYCRLYNSIYDLPVIIVRLFNVYGPRQRKYLMYDTLLKLEENPHTLTMLGSGNQKRDFIYVKDAVEGLILLSANEECYGETLNLGTGIPTSVKEVVTRITKILGVTPNVKYTGMSWKGDIKSLVADVAKLRKIGFTPKYRLEQGIERLISWFQEVRRQRH